MRLITGSVAVGIFIAAGAGVAAVHYSGVLANDHAIVAQPTPAQAARDTRNGTDDGVDDRTSPSPSSADESKPEPEATDDSRTKLAAGDDSPTHVSDDSSHKGGSAPKPADDHGSDGGR